MSFTTIPQLTLPENRPTPSQGSLSRYEFRTAPYDAFDPGPWPWRPTAEYRRDIRTGRHRRDEAPDPLSTRPVTHPRTDPSAEPTTEADTKADTDPGSKRHSEPGATTTRRPSPHPVPPSDLLNPLREQAWARFLERSESLAKAHNDNRTKPRILWSRLVRALRKAAPHRFGRSSSPVPLRIHAGSKSVSAA